MKCIITTLFLVSCLSTLPAQIIKDTKLSGMPSPEDVQTIELYADTISNSMIVFAPKGFNKQRIGVPTREQIMILEGKATFTFEKQVLEAKTGMYLVIPANTPHRVQVADDIYLKMLVIQDASDQ